MTTYRSGFTIIELLVTLIVVSVLAAIVTLSYNAWRQDIAETAVKADLSQAAGLLKSVHNFKGTYPTSIFSQELSNNNQPSFKPSQHVTVSLRTDATTLPRYSGLSQAQNAQLFLDACNSAMPIRSTNTSTVYHASCYSVVAGFLQFRVSSSKGLAYIANPVNSTFNIQCNNVTTSVCNESDYATVHDAAIASMKQRFENQGGTFPVTLPHVFFGATLPTPSSTYSYDNATKYCLEGVSKDYPDIVFHIKSSAPTTTQAGACPTNTSQF